MLFRSDHPIGNLSEETLEATEPRYHADGRGDEQPIAKDRAQGVHQTERGDSLPSKEQTRKEVRDPRLATAGISHLGREHNCIIIGAVRPGLTLTYLARQ